jgi:predicted protein tyrosine phosphatase
MICVSSLSHLPATVARIRPSHILSLLSPNQDTPHSVEIAKATRLRLSFNDIVEYRPDLIMPSTTTISDIVAFGRSWSGERSLLVHCWAGISRSSAAAYILACDRNPGSEDDIANELRKRAPFATPNRLMIELADQFFAREGRMIEAIARIGRGAEAFEGIPYELPTNRPRGT